MKKKEEDDGFSEYISKYMFQWPRTLWSWIETLFVMAVLTCIVSTFFIPTLHGATGIVSATVIKLASTVMLGANYAELDFTDPV